MFSRTSCYFFVRPRKTFLELCFFLNRAVNAPPVRRVDRASKSKLVHIVHIKHRDEVEAPVTDWLEEAYELAGAVARKAGAQRASRPEPVATKKAARGRKPVTAVKAKRR
jgi:hypothetical protein